MIKLYLLFIYINYINYTLIPFYHTHTYILSNYFEITILLIEIKIIKIMQNLEDYFEEEKNLIENVLKIL